VKKQTFHVFCGKVKVGSFVSNLTITFYEVAMAEAVITMYAYVETGAYI
jgi:hypothetical protein